MTERVVTAVREIAAPAATIFEFIADPARQPAWTATTTWPRPRRAGGTRRREVFAMTTRTTGRG